jgi:FkbM family methyltransferase
VNPILNWLVRAYLYRVPVTEGKKQLLRLTRDRILPKGDIVTFTTRHGFRLTANLHNPEHQRMYFYGEHDERYEINILKKVLCTGDVCWDIGANIGFFSCLFASLIGPAGRVIAFEPLPATADFLRRNLELNGFHNVLIVRKAVGATPATRPIYYDDAASAEGTASFLSSHAEQDFEIVQIDTLDNLNGKLPPADFIKIDVEGYQMEVLDGGREYFAQHNPMIMAELKDRDRGKMQRAQDFFADYGYTPYEFEKRSLRRCENIASSRKRNFFMAKQDSPYQTRIERLVQAC